MSQFLLTNAFSLNMLASLDATVEVKSVGASEAADLASSARSVVGHQDTAHVFTSVLGLEVPANRESVALEKGDRLLVGQYRGPRLPEGATELPEGASIEWCLLAVR